MENTKLEAKKKEKRFSEIAKPNYTNPPTRLIRNNYNIILDKLMANLKNAIGKITPNATAPPMWNNVPAVVTALQALNDAINLWLEFNDYEPVTCFCIQEPKPRQIFIKPIPAAAGGGNRKKTRKSKHRKTKRNSRTIRKSKKNLSKNKKTHKRSNKRSSNSRNKNTRSNIRKMRGGGVKEDIDAYIISNINKSTYKTMESFIKANYTSDNNKIQNITYNNTTIYFKFTGNPRMGVELLASYNPNKDWEEVGATGDEDN